MRHSIFVVTFVVLALALPSQAVVNITELAMTLTYDAAGNAALHNNTGSALNVDGLEIHSAGSNLDPVGWQSIADSAAADPTGTLNALGIGALSFGEFVVNAGLLAEGNLSSQAVFQPSAPWGIGQPFNPGTATGDLTFFYSRPETPGDKYLGVIVVPEPATLGLLLIGGLALLRRRR